MATETLAVNLLLNANQYKREAQSAATATGRISGSANQATTATGKLQGQMGTLATTAKFAIAGVATAAVADFARDSIAAASNLNESINAVNVTFGEAADGIHEIGESAADSFGMSERAFNEFAVRFSAFAKNIAEGSGRDVVDIVNEMSTRVADFASVHNLSLEEAAQVAQSTLAGETEVFRRFGGDVSAAAVQAKGLELGLSGVGDELTEGEKQLIRYQLFMEQTSNTAGDFARTSGDLANAQRRVNSNLEDAQAKIGQAVVPVLGDMAAALADVLGFLDDLSVTLPATGEEFSVLEGFVKASAGGIFGVISLVKDAWTGFFGDAAEAQKEHLAATEESIDAANRHRGSMKDLGDEISGATVETEKYGMSLEDVIELEDERAETTARMIQEMADYRDALREIHNPLFRMVGLNEDLEEAQKAVDKATKPDEFRAAVIRRAEILADLEATYIELKEQGIDPTGAAAQQMLEGLEIPPDVLADIMRQFDQLEADWENRRLDTTFRFPSFRPTINGTVVGTGSTVIGPRQHGGIDLPVPGGKLVQIAEAGSAEATIPLNSEGARFMSMTMLEAMKMMDGGGSSTTVNLFTLARGDFMQELQKAGVDIQRLGW